MPTPDIRVTNAVIDPPNTFRASKLSECYSIRSSRRERTYNYRVGLAPEFDPMVWVIQNNTVSHDIQVVIDVPTFTTLQSERTVIIPKNSTREIPIAFNEEDAKGKVMTRTRNFAENVSVRISVLNVSGPVYVRTDSAARSDTPSGDAPRTDIPVGDTTIPIGANPRPSKNTSDILN